MANENKVRILKLNSSFSGERSVTNRAGDLVLSQILNEHPEAEVITRDLSSGLPLIDGEWGAANFTPEEQRTPLQKEALALSDTLIEELEQTDILLIGLPLINFGMSASLKTWVDLITRARKTFRYTENGPVGLLADRKTHVVFASGGTPLGADFEYATPYLRKVLSFVGITDLEIVDGKQLLKQHEENATVA